MGSRWGLDDTRRYGSGQRVTIGAASVSSAIFNGPDEVLMHGDSRCFVLSGPPGTTVTNATGIPLEAGEKFHMQVGTGHVIAVIRDSADGFLNIVPVV